MEEIKEKDFFANANESLKKAVNNILNNIIERQDIQINEELESFAILSFKQENKKILVIYKYKIMANNDNNISYRFFIGNELDDYALDEINRIKAKDKEFTFLEGLKYNEL